MKRKRKKRAPRAKVLHTKTINFTLREYASIQMYAHNHAHGMTCAEAVAEGTYIANQLKAITQFQKETL